LNGARRGQRHQRAAHPAGGPSWRQCAYTVTGRTEADGAEAASNWPLV
jgi:hypothetical protein